MKKFAALFALALTACASTGEVNNPSLHDYTMLAPRKCCNASEVKRDGGRVLLVKPKARIVERTGI